MCSQTHTFLFPFSPFSCPLHFSHPHLHPHLFLSLSWISIAKHHRSLPQATFLSPGLPLSLFLSLSRPTPVSRKKEKVSVFCSLHNCLQLNTVWKLLPSFQTVLLVNHIHSFSPS